MTGFGSSRCPSFSENQDNASRRDAIANYKNRDFENRVIAMKHFILGSMLFAVAALVGCGNTDSKSGGPGVSKNPDNANTVTQKDDTFSLDVPNLATSLNQGETKNIGISINRGKNFGQDVTLKFDGVPKGVTLDPASGMLKAGDKEVTFKATAAADAALGDHEVTVTGTPTSGPSATNKFKIKVSKP